MKKVILTLLILAVPLSLFAGQWEAIIYANFRAPAGEEIKEHWKPEIPDVGIDEVIRDFRRLETQGSKRVYHALVQTTDGTTGQIKRIKDHIRVVNGCVAPTLQGPTCTTPMAQQIHAFWGKDADIMYTNLWQARSDDAFYMTLAKGVLRYPVETTCDGEPCTLIVSVTEAETTYGETIDAQKLMVPHRFYGK
jgi:hypothetical protein